MALKDFLGKFEFDKDTFDYDAFKKKIESEHDAELTEVRDLTGAEITRLTEDNTKLGGTIQEQKLKLYDALMNSGPVVKSTPNGAPAGDTDTDDAEVPAALLAFMNSGKPTMSNNSMRED